MKFCRIIIWRIDSFFWEANFPISPKEIRWCLKRYNCSKKSPFGLKITKIDFNERSVHDPSTREKKREGRREVRCENSDNVFQRSYPLELYSIFFADVLLYVYCTSLMIGQDVWTAYWPRCKDKLQCLETFSKRKEAWIIFLRNHASKFRSDFAIELHLSCITDVSFK